MPLTGKSAGAESSDADEDSGDWRLMHAEINAIVGALDSLALQTNPSHVPCTGSSPKSESDQVKAVEVSAGNPSDQLHQRPILRSPDVQGVADLILDGCVKRCVVMVGAGISVSAGIPDFRTPGTGLYDNLKQYNLPDPEAIFDVDFFQEDPRPFCKLAKELLPGNYKPTPTHFFLTLLHKKGLLQRCFTQNIDSLEVAAGLPKDMVIAAHGNFDTASCVDCRKPAKLDRVLSRLSQEQVPTCEHCKGFVKPDIVFFGESLPCRFFFGCENDLPTADLAIVMGTSLSVTPFASLPELVNPYCPRLLINREIVGDFDCDAGHYPRDAVFQGDCDDGVAALVKLLGWDTDFAALLNGTTC